MTAFLLILWVAGATIGWRLNKKDERIAEDERLLKEWEADAIIRKLQGRSMYVRPGHTNSTGPM